jgi:epidermal growth factor receptor substrate 15
MYLIKASMSGQLSAMPNSLPPELYQQASGYEGVSKVTGGSGYFSASTHTPSHMNQQHVGADMHWVRTTDQIRDRARPFSTVLPAWDITAAEKVSADSIFDTLDSQKVGYIEGDVATSFMSKSNLPVDTLAEVWSVLSHIHH